MNSLSSIIIRGAGLTNSGLIFCRTYQANPGNKKYKAEYAINSKCFNATGTARRIYEQNCCINKTAYAKNSKQSSEDSFKIHLLTFMI